MEIQFPARDRAEENRRKTEEDLSQSLETLAELKEFLLAKQRFEDIVALREVEKTIEKSIEIVKSISIKG